MTDDTPGTSMFVFPSSNVSIPREKAHLTPLVCDERAIARLLDRLLGSAGLSVNEAARRLGVSSNTVRQYLRGRRNKPSLLWFVRLADLCGAKVTIEFPNR